jgi:uridylate kinase
MKQYLTPKRVLLKLSGEALQGNQWYGIDPQFLAILAKKVAYLAQKQNIQIVIVVGGGNIFRGITLEAWWFDRVTGDYMWMLGTIINGLAIGEAIEKEWIDVRVMTAIPTERVAEVFIRRRALRHIEKWRIVICVGWSGNPYFTTDSCAVLRGLELGCDVVVKATKVDGIYNKDPKKHSDATRHDTLHMHEVIVNDIRVMDQAAIALAHDEKIPIYVCRIEDIDQIGTDEIIGTYVSVNQ